MSYSLLKQPLDLERKGLRVKTRGRARCEREKIKMSYCKLMTVRSQPSETQLEKKPPSQPQGQFMVPYVSDTQDEFSSSVQRIFLLAAFHTEDVDLAEMASCGNVLGVWGEGDRPRIDWRRQQREGGTHQTDVCCKFMQITVYTYDSNYP